MTSEDLKRRREALNLSQIELGAAIGKSRKTINLYENHGNIPEGVQKLLEIFFLEKEEGVNVTEIKENSNETLPKEKDAFWVQYSRYKEVPIVTHRAQAGFLAGWGDPHYEEELPKALFEVDREYKGKYICFEVSGDSMEDGSVESIMEGDLLLCREVQRLHWTNHLHINQWDFVIVHKTDGILVKRITKHDTETGKLILHSLNPLYDDYDVYMDDLIAIFNVVKVDRNRRR